MFGEIKEVQISLLSKRILEISVSLLLKGEWIFLFICLEGSRGTGLDKLEVETLAYQC